MKSITIGFIALLFVGCDKSTLRISDDTFLLDDEVYKIIDNEVLLLGKLDQGIKEYSVTELDSLRDMGEVSLSFIKPQTSAALQTIYRGSYLYYHIIIVGFRQDWDNYSGSITINFYDRNEFILHREIILKNQITEIVGNKGEAEYHVHHGKNEMSSGVYRSIARYDVSSSLSKKKESWWD